MFTGRQKIVKANGAEPDEFEASVAQELFNLEVKGSIKSKSVIYASIANFSCNQTVGRVANNSFLTVIPAVCYERSQPVS